MTKVSSISKFDKYSDTYLVLTLFFVQSPLLDRSRSIVSKVNQYPKAHNPPNFPFACIQINHLSSASMDHNHVSPHSEGRDCPNYMKRVKDHLTVTYFSL